MSEIDRIYYINQDRAVNRRWSCFGGLVSHGAPANQIYRFRSRTDYYPHVRTNDDLIRIAERDFPRFKNAENDIGYEPDLGLLGAVYSMLVLLRHVSDRDETVLILQDDMILRKPYRSICDIIRNLSPDIMMFRYASPEKTDELKREGRKAVRCRISPTFNKLKDHPTEKDVLQGIAGNGVWANVISGAGARRILDEWHTEGCPFSVEYTVWSLSFQDDQSGFYSVKKPDGWFIDSTRWTKQDRRNIKPGPVSDHHVNGFDVNNLFKG